MRQRGFNLIELMVAMAILAFLMAAGMPSIGTWLDNTRIRNEGESIINGMQTARAEAVRRNMNVSFWLVKLTNPAVLANDCSLLSTSGSWVVSVSNPENQCAADITSTDPTVNPAGVILGRPIGSDSARISVDAKQSDGTTASTFVTFNGFGRVASTTSIATIALNGTGSGPYRNLQVVVTTTGAIRMCDPAVPNTGTDPRRCLQ